MKNYKKYAEEIKKKCNVGTNFCDTFAKPKILKPQNLICGQIACAQCHALVTLWLLEDYKEPETDWSKVAVDTPILVRDDSNEAWLRKHFAKYEDGEVYAWGYGHTSWTGATMDFWKHAKLAEVENG